MEGEWIILGLNIHMTWFQEGLQAAKDYLFPVFCLSCNTEGVWVCTACMKMLEIKPQLYCPQCHVSTHMGSVCATCVHSSMLTQHVALLKYVEVGLVGKLIHVFKYQYAEEVLGVIGECIQTFVTKHTELFQDIDIVVPVPLYKKRFAERGFNQSASIASVLGNVLQKPIDEKMLIRTRHTPHQAKLDREGRLKNVQDAFVVNHSLETVGKHILLVDDVYTTGATMQACAKAFKDAGALRVSGCTFARG